MWCKLKYTFEFILIENMPAKLRFKYESLWRIVRLLQTQWRRTELQNFFVPWLMLYAYKFIYLCMTSWKIVNYFCTLHPFYLLPATKAKKSLLNECKLKTRVKTIKFAPWELKIQGCVSRLLKLVPHSFSTHSTSPDFYSSLDLTFAIKKV